MKPQKDADSRKNNRLYYTLSDGDFPLRLMSPRIHSLISLYLHSDPANLCHLHPSRKVTDVSITVKFLICKILYRNVFRNSYDMIAFYLFNDMNHTKFASRIKDCFRVTTFLKPSLNGNFEKLSMRTVMSLTMCCSARKRTKMFEKYNGNLVSFS